MGIGVVRNHMRGTPNSCSLVPAVWLVLFFALMRMQRPIFPSYLPGAVTLILAVLRITLCGLRWRRNLAALGVG
jgi:hypothetical protein